MTRLAHAFSRGRFVPELELLEDRTAPAVQVVQAGNIVLVQGDGANNPVIVLDNGTRQGGAVRIGDGVTGQTLFSLRGRVVNPEMPLLILFRLGAGDDSVSYNLTDSLDGNQAGRMGSAGRSLDVQLGAGNDVFRFAPLSPPGQLFNNIAVVNAGLLVNAVGGDGNDQIGLNLGAGLASVATTVLFQAVGGAGNDTLTSVVELFQTGPSPSLVLSSLVGGPGQDAFFSLLSPDTSSTANPPPSMRGAVAGDASDLAVVTPGLVTVSGVPFSRVFFF
jgi:hypothetical protein